MEKRVCVTGGNKGIGLEITRLFLASGCEVAVVARDFAAFPLADEPGVATLPFDLTDVEAIPGLVERMGPVDVLVNNAGVMFSLPYDAYPEDKVRRMLRINLEAPVALIRECSRAMLEKGAGRIVNVASVAGHTGHPDVWYGVAKAGLINLTKSFAQVLGPGGVVVNAVAPSPTETDMLATIPEARREAFLKRVILGRFARPEEVARTVHWLGTDSPEYINGVCIDLNNGSLPR
ncbi:MAG: SDR family oxidoreductase [Desulfovibrionaceae bacterium]|jgi:3-oxoacyl-[acyl-carrier protein] reductase|nr:SDR family oxidoreductase [Desulfovibrionaceae bacterium]